MPKAMPTTRDDPTAILETARIKIKPVEALRLTQIAAFYLAALAKCNVYLASNRNEMHGIF